MHLFLQLHFVGTIALGLLCTCSKKETKDNHYINIISFDIYQQFIKRYFNHFIAFIRLLLLIFLIFHQDWTQHFLQGLLKFYHFSIGTSSHLIKPIEYLDQCIVHLSNCNYISQINQIMLVIAIIIAVVIENFSQTTSSVIFDLTATTITNYSLYFNYFTTTIMNQILIINLTVKMVGQQKAMFAVQFLHFNFIFVDL